MTLSNVPLPGTLPCGLSPPLADVLHFLADAIITINSVLHIKVASPTGRTWRPYDATNK
jgi:hypothetical protein